MDVQGKTYISFRGVLYSGIRPYVKFAFTRMGGNLLIIYLLYIFGSRGRLSENLPSVKNKAA